jgi:hypothetical protein
VEVARDVSLAVRQLRRADEQQLRVVKAALERGRFAVLVADDGVWPLAREALGVEPAGELVLESGDDVMQMFASPVTAGEGVVFLHVGEEAAGAMAALNLNRDKLKGRSCRFLLRLGGIEAYRRFVRDAPDAYSVRDAAVVLETKEAVDIGPAPEGEPDADVERRIGAAREALQTAEQKSPPDTEHVLRQALSFAAARQSRDDIRGASEALERLKVPWWAPGANRFFVSHLAAGILVDEGCWREARTKLEEALRASASTNDRFWVVWFAVQLARLLVDQGEPEAGLDVIASIDTRAAGNLRLRVRRSQADADAFRDLESLAYAPPPDSDLRFYALERARDDANWVRRAVRAGLFQQEILTRADAAITALAARVAEDAPRDPPWLRIDAELLVADQHLAGVGGEQAATEPAERGLALARRGAPELVPACVRRLAVAALRSGSTEQLDILLEEAAQAAEVHHLPGEAARIAGLRLWHAVQQHGAVDGAEKALEEAFDRSGSVLVQAEVLLRTGRGAGRPDLVSRARRIYRSLPWPEREGACLEALGMVDAARARYEAFGLKLAALALDRSPAPEPVDA